MHVDLLIHNVGQLVTVAGPPGPRAGALQGELGIVANGAVAVSGETIAAAGPEEAVLKSPGIDAQTVEIDAGGAVVTPGLIDSHTHLAFAGTRQNEFELRVRGATYEEIMAAGGGIYASVRRTREVSLEQLAENAESHLRTMLAYGTTTAEAKSGYGLDLDTEIRQLEALRLAGERQPVEVVPTYLGAHAVPQGMEPDAYVAWMEAEAIPEIARRELACFCDVFCERGAFTPEQSERILRAGQRHGLQAKLHADELADTGGALLAARLGAVSADHLHCANEAGLKAMAEAGVIATLLPGTAVFLGLPHHAPARRMVEMGVPVAIATDFNPGTCYSESLPLMLSFACTQLHLTPAEALVGATLNAAYAAGRGDHLGSLEAGKQADLVIWDADDYRLIPYHMGINLARSVIKRGQIVLRQPLTPVPSPTRGEGS
ncbi:MAG TPA: imidazolonepropionase [Chthonomonadaceae bacterium]|nr:imidazolonepropionase [Chthonomonadaceae bacterium]